MRKRRLRVLDLFSGIGGFSLGLERTGGFETVAFCEIEEYPRAVLRKHWPDVPIFEDVRTLKGEDFGPVDVICGGFPCQPYSTASAGRRKGAEDDRALWPEMFRIIAATRPSWVVGENVAGIKTMDLERVVFDLEGAGYRVGVFVIPACAVGLDHRRDRVWIIGHADQNGKPECSQHEETSRLRNCGKQLEGLGATHGVSAGMAALGNAVVPQIPEMIGRAILAAEAEHG
jgi:DNA (cytosine-5)-methyltransferase 1